MAYRGSYLWRLRQRVGSDLVLMPAAQVLVFDEHGRVLLMRRADTGQWALIAGNAEQGLSSSALAIAELAEEAGLTAAESDLEPFAHVSDPAYTMVYPNGDRVHSFALCFAVRRWSGSPCPDGDEVAELEFFAPTTLPMPRHPEVDCALRLWAAYADSGRFQLA